MEQARYRIEVYSIAEDQRGRALARHLAGLGIESGGIRTSDNYLVNAPITDEQCAGVGRALINRVTQRFSVNTPYMPDNNFHWVCEVGFLPGVTDNVAHTAREVIEDLFKIECDLEKSVFTTVSYFIDADLSPEQIRVLADELHNPLIQRAKILSRKEYGASGFGNAIPVVHLSGRSSVDRINLNITDDDLATLGRDGIKDADGTPRGPLALDLPSIKAIQKYFSDKEKRQPTDLELESIAQTWSEHCKHTIFAASIDGDNDGFYKKYIRAATERIRREKGSKDFCVSVFTDNAGGIIFDENYIVADKVETHNSPSALDPFGGSITGIVGVNRDLMGFGMGARPVANRYGFCFADPFDHAKLYRARNDESAQLLSPRRIMDGVVKGVNAGGNCSGIPTPQGFVYFDKRYKGKPLVFVGTIGLIPRKVRGESSVEKCAEPGDVIVVAGGRVGKDGIHGATFSSEALTSGSPATAVQIGDPITQKKLSDAIVKEARDAGLYRSITDNGAGGLSCSVAEMAKESNGFECDLEKVPLKYPGLSPWEIWVSESQERMTFAVQPENVNAFLDLMKRRGVEATVLGTFTSTGRGVVRHQGEVVFDLDLDFLHNGLPRKELTTRYAKPARKSNLPPVKKDYTDDLRAMLSRLNVTSFAYISSQYDHEVQANSVIKPLQGVGRVNGNASVIRPIHDSKKGVVLSQGLYPSYSEIDAYRMAASSIDTAVRNAIAVGGSLDHLAILDNFCWCDSLNPDRLGQLKAAAQACYDYAVAYGTPYVSGKDSMFNDFKGFDEKGDPVKLSVPPTLLVSSFGVIDDVTHCQTIDFKFDDDLVYILGDTLDESAGSEYESYLCESSGKEYTAAEVPSVDAVKNAKLYRSFEQALKKNLIASSASIERGGLAVALAKSAIAGIKGATIDLSAIGKDRADSILFSESQGRFLVSVDPKKQNQFEEIFAGQSFRQIGTVTKESFIRVSAGSGDVVKISLDDASNAYSSTFREF
jgi:phosphoribosylformylglycinamidine synthase